MVEWAERFDAPILLHAADREWVMRPSPRIELWERRATELSPALELVRLGGHFAGGTVLPVARAAPRAAARCCRATSSRSSPTATG